MNRKCCLKQVDSGEILNMPLNLDKRKMPLQVWDIENLKKIFSKRWAVSVCENSRVEMLFDNQWQHFELEKQESQYHIHIWITKEVN